METPGGEALRTKKGNLKNRTTRRREKQLCKKHEKNILLIRRLRRSEK
jgi:hypothetical protein